MKLFRLARNRLVTFLDWAMAAAVTASGYILAVTVIMIAIFIISQAWPMFYDVSLTEFIFGTIWRPISDPPVFGIVPFILGSALIVFWALLLGVPLGLGCAIYLAEMASPGIRAVGRTIIATLAGIPSVVYGLIGLLVVAPKVAGMFSLSTGLTGFSAGLMLGLMIVPTVVSFAEESILAVPEDYREAALALGATPSEAFWTAVFPAALSGIVAGLMLAAGRALGETMTVLMVAGGRLAVPAGLFQPMRTMTALLASEINNAPQGGVQYSALFGVGTVLFILTLGITLAVDIVLHKSRGGSA